MPWLTHDYSWGSRGINTIIILGEDAIGWEYAVCDLSEVFSLRDFSQSPPIMVGLTTKTSSPTTYYFDTPSLKPTPNTPSSTQHNKSMQLSRYPALIMASGF